MTAWVQQAAQEELFEVRAEAFMARAEWSSRLRRSVELRDLAPWARGGWFAPAGAVNAAAQVAVEMAIVVLLWPERTSWR
jgi:hypothetical protein